jgi:hypothetical protein
MILYEYTLETFAEADRRRVVVRNDDCEILLPDYQVRMTVLALLALVSLTDWASLEEAESRILRMPRQAP